MIHILTNWIIEPYDDLNRCRKCVWQNSTPIWLLSLSKTAHNLSVGCVSPRVSLVFWEGLYPIYTVCISFFTMAHSWILSCVKPRTSFGSPSQGLTQDQEYEHPLMPHFFYNIFTFLIVRKCAKLLADWLENFQHVKLPPKDGWTKQDLHGIWSLRERQTLNKLLPHFNNELGSVQTILVG